MGDNIRLKRVQALIRDEIGTMIVMGIVKDPRISHMSSVTDVRVSKDINYAKVYISSFEDHASLEKTVAALNHASGFIQQRLAKRMKTRNTPKLSFFMDNSIENGIRMTNLLEELDT